MDSEWMDDAIDFEDAVIQKGFETGFQHGTLKAKDSLYHEGFREGAAFGVTLGSLAASLFDTIPTNSRALLVRHTCIDAFCSLQLLNDDDNALVASRLSTKFKLYKATMHLYISIAINPIVAHIQRVGYKFYIRNNSYLLIQH